MKIVLFGAGKFYQAVKHKMPSQVEVAAFLDNDPRLQGKYLDGIKIIPPEDLHGIDYEKIVLTSAREQEMKSQLLELGVEEKDIWYWEFFLSEMNHGTLRLFCGNVCADQTRKKILVISMKLEYSGGPVVAMYAAKALQDRGNVVVLAAPEGDPNFIREATEGGVNVVLCPALPYVHDEELFWINQFDAVLVNVFPMIFCACDISKIKPVMWWIHEASDVYGKILGRFQGYGRAGDLDRINICAVSDIARQNFHAYFPGQIKKTLAYGIPDERDAGEPENMSECLVFAIIGAVCPKKGQDIFLEAMELLETEEKKNVQCWFIGTVWEDEYASRVRKLSAHNVPVKFWGTMPRKEMRALYRETDIVVCPSREEPMSLAVTEGMMYGKACIVSDSAGMAEYVVDGENGLIFKTGNVEDLSEKLAWTIRNRRKLQKMGIKARHTYETYFSLETFGERLEAALQDTIEDYRRISQV